MDGGVGASEGAQGRAGIGLDRSIQSAFGGPVLGDASATREGPDATTLLLPAGAHVQTRPTPTPRPQSINRRRMSLLVGSGESVRPRPRSKDGFEAPPRQGLKLCCSDRATELNRIMPSARPHRALPTTMKTAASALALLLGAGTVHSFIVPAPTAVSLVCTRTHPIPFRPHHTPHARPPLAASSTPSGGRRRTNHDDDAPPTAS